MDLEEITGIARSMTKFLNKIKENLQFHLHLPREKRKRINLDLSWHKVKIDRITFLLLVDRHIKPIKTIKHK